MSSIKFIWPVDVILQGMNTGIPQNHTLKLPIIAKFIRKTVINISVFKSVYFSEICGEGAASSFKRLQFFEIFIVRIQGLNLIREAMWNIFLIDVIVLMNQTKQQLHNY